ncbi:hypothetical protein G7Y79_00036g071550 [Physcia stellaris]|nr:hypothetical protein G7Y79_00036g071550 [Physcia stellaris]
MAAVQAAQIYKQDARARQNLLTREEREDLFKPYLPPAPKSNARKRPSKRQPLRDFVRTQVYVFIYNLMHAVFSLYIRLRQTYHVVLDRSFAILYYHHRAPELIRQDVRGLNRLPEHLSVILDLKSEERGTAAIEKLMDDVAEISTWCTCVGIPMLSVYEKTGNLMMPMSWRFTDLQQGALKAYIPTTHRVVSRKMHSYFGQRVPSFQIRAPHVPSFLNGEGSDEADSLTSSSEHLSILLISAEDGRSTLVDLTKTLTEMSQRGKLSSHDISLDLIDTEITESIMGEPDLLVLFGSHIALQGYPPWQVRLTEIFHVPDNAGVGYQTFLRALHSYAKASMKFGR